MTNNIENYINEINRLMKYDRSKTIIEQQKKPVGPRADVEAGPIAMSPMSKIKTTRYKTKEEISGESFGYPEYCGSPSYAIDGDVNHPAYPEWCIYQSPKGVMYFPKDSKVIQTIEGEQSWSDLFGIFLERPVGNTTLDEYFERIGEVRGEDIGKRLRGDFYESLTKIFPVGSVRKIIIGGRQYGPIVTGSIIADTNIVNDDGSERDDFKIEWRFKGYKTISGNIYYTPPSKEVLQPSGLDIVKHEGSNMAIKGFEQLSSYLCGPESPFAGGTILGSYKTETLACDIAAILLYVLGGPVGVIAGMSIEFANAKALWDDGDKFGAVIATIFAVLPGFGSVIGNTIKTLITKIGKNSFIKVLTFISNFIRFLLGDLKGMDIWDIYKTLSKAEREAVFEITSQLPTMIDKSVVYLDEVYELLGKVDNIPGIDVSQVRSKIKYIIDESNIIRGVKNVGIQFSSIMTLIFGASVVESAISSYNEENNDTITIDDLELGTGLTEEQRQELYKIIESMVPTNE